MGLHLQEKIKCFAWRRCRRYVSFPSSPLLTRSQQEIESSGTGYGMGTALHTQFATEVQDVFLDGVDAKYQGGCDLAVGRAIYEQPQHLTLASSEWFHQRVGAQGREIGIRISGFTCCLQQGHDVSRNHLVLPGLAQQSYHR